MTSDNALPERLDQILRYGLYQADLPPPANPPELAEIMGLVAAAQDSRQHKGHPVEPLGPSIAAILGEVLLAYLADHSDRWPAQKRVSQYLAGLIILEQYLAPVDRQQARAEVLYYLTHPSHLNQRWGLSTELAQEIQAAAQQIEASSTYYRRRQAGIKLLAEALRQWAGTTSGCARREPILWPQLDQGLSHQRLLVSSPRQAPYLSPFYIPRESLQQSILTQLNQEKVSTLILLGPGGAGKTTLATWAVQDLVDQFSDGQFWVEVQPGNQVSDIQARLGRSLGVTLLGQSPGERAGELRTLLADKRCLLVLDDVWDDPELPYLLVTNPASRLLITSRDSQVAARLQGPAIQVGGLTHKQGNALLTTWLGQVVNAPSLISRLAGHPLALTLCAAQLRAGHITLAELGALFQDVSIDLHRLDVDEPSHRQDSLALCFDLSYQRLKPTEQQQFAQLGCFVGYFDERVLTALGGREAGAICQILRRLSRFALVEQGERGYRLHPLLRDYARQKLNSQPELARLSYGRYAAWYIRHELFHPKVLDDEINPAALLTESWAEVIVGVNWACVNEPFLASLAFLLAYSERPALLAAVGPSLVGALEHTLERVTNPRELALWAEQLAYLRLWVEPSDFNQAISLLAIATQAWEVAGNLLAAAVTHLRQAGIYLLQEQSAAALQQARSVIPLIRRAYPVPKAELDDLRWVFYWLDVLYSRLVLWPVCPQEAVVEVAELAQASGYPIIKGRGLHIQRLWWSAEGMNRIQAEADRQIAISLAVEAFWVWRACGERDKADREVTWATYELKGRFSRQTARRFARRFSQTTPVVSSETLKLIEDKAIRWWLGATERQRLDWLSRMMPRYLKPANGRVKALPVGGLGEYWVKTILSISTLGRTVRRPAPGINLSVNSLNLAEVSLFSGQKALPIVGDDARTLVLYYLEKLETNQPL